MSIPRGSFPRSSELASPLLLVVDDDPDMRLLAEMALQRLGRVVCVDRVAAAIPWLDQHPSVVLVDLELPGTKGDGLLQEVRSRSPLSRVFIVSGVRDIERAVSLLHQGAEDYLLKPVDPFALSHKVERCLLQQRLASRLHHLESLGTEGENSPSMVRLSIGSSQVMTELRRQIQVVAGTDLPVLVEGETGTGKELVARAVHEMSRRRGGPFVTVNCGAIPRELMEAELFGHLAGSFTGATSSRKGMVREAESGTLFLDEVGELPLELQPKLLRFLQEKEIRPVGGDKPVKTDVRVVAATHRDLSAGVVAGSFRQDLYYRLRVLPVSVPPLRERQSDLPALAEFFLREAAGQTGRELRGFEKVALRALMACPWPGNVRELQNKVQRSAVFAEGPLVTVGNLDLAGGASAQGVLWPDELFELPLQEARDRLMGEFDREYVARQLREAGGNVSEAARRAGLPRKSFWRIAQRVGMGHTLAQRRAGLEEGTLVELSSQTGDPPSGHPDPLALAREEYRLRTLEKVARLLKDLNHPMGLEGWRELKETAHRLRGSGGSYGWPQVSLQAEGLERAAETLARGEAIEALLALREALGG